MAFTIQCTNKGCGNLQQPYLDKATDKIHCSLCDKEIINISVFVKNQMKQSKQFRPAKKVPFATKCKNCPADERPKLVGGDIVCAVCNKKMDHLLPSFVLMLKDQLKKTDQDL
jgi:hypothetical protein